MQGWCKIQTAEGRNSTGRLHEQLQLADFLERHFVLDDPTAVGELLTAMSALVHRKLPEVLDLLT